MILPATTSTNTVDLFQGEQSKLETNVQGKEKQAEELAQKIRQMQAALQQTTADAVNAIAAQHNSSSN